jgi:biofilm PGA synthesis N-glycosyltransferase PgaC
MMNTLIAVILAFAFYYPLFMAWLWMQGAVFYYWHYERKDPPVSQPPALNYPPVSVIIPCYNEGQNARETIGAALALDYPDFEVIAVNDGSTDDTGSILNELAASNPRLRVIHQSPNQGKAVG